MVTGTGPRDAPHDLAVSDETERRRLLERPAFSIRARVIVAFVVLFVLISVDTVGGVVAASELREREHLLAKVESYAAQVQDARQRERDFFLFGNDLAEALASVHTAGQRLESSAEALQASIGQTKVEAMRERLRTYEGQLEQLDALGDSDELKDSQKRRQIELRLRKLSAQILFDTEEVIEQQRRAMDDVLDTMMTKSVAFLIFMFFFLTYVARLIASSVLRPIRRFLRYAARIGAGDYSPIAPARKYRDEFSTLALAINQMLGELKARQEELLQTRKMAAVGTLTSGIAHELNNPLNNIALTTEALIEGVEEYSQEETLRMLGQISTQLERAGSTVRNLLDFTRKEQPAFTSVSIPDVLQATARLVGNELNLGHVALDLDVPDSLPEVSGNPRNLEQVFLNLFLNSIQAMPDGGTLTVRGREEDGLLRVDVADTGVGIPPEIIGQVFDPFFTTKDAGEGTGLGLSVSYGIVEKHGGRILVESEVGTGTTFSVLLPSRSEAGDAGRRFTREEGKALEEA